MTSLPKTLKEFSPFSPGQPVAPPRFVGRKEQIDRILRSVRQVRAGKQENLFITGEYGIGKSSLVSYVRALAKEQFGQIGFHVFLGGVDTIEAMTQKVLDAILQQVHADKLLDRVGGFLGRYVKEVQFFGVTLNLENLKPDLPGIAHGFLPFLRQLHEHLGKDSAGFGLYLDDLNGIARAPSFASFLKSLVDEIAVSSHRLPLLLVLGGIPQRRHEIIANVSSVERIFDVVEIAPLADAEVEDFFRRAFGSVNIEVDAEALSMLTFFSGGLPKLMHELGEAAFWTDSDNQIDKNDATAAVFTAAETVGRKYFEPIRAALKSPDYHAILAKLPTAAQGGAFDRSFRKDVVAKALNDKERRKFNNFLQRMKRLGALSQGEIRGEWVFPDRLIRMYLMMESIRNKSHPHAFDR